MRPYNSGICVDEILFDKTLIANAVGTCHGTSAPSMVFFLIDDVSPQLFFKKFKFYLDFYHLCTNFAMQTAMQMPRSGESGAGYASSRQESRGTT